MTSTSQTCELTAGLSAARQVTGWAAIILAITYGLSGIALIAPEEVGIVRRLGRWRAQNGKVDVRPSGLVLAWPYPIDQITRLPVKQEILLELDDFWQGDQPADDPVASPEMLPCVLCGDQNLVNVKLRVKYRIADPVAYLASASNPESLILHTIRSGVATSLNTWSIDEALGQRRYPAQTPNREGEFKQLIEGNGSNPVVESDSLISAASYLHEDVVAHAQLRLNALQVGVALTAVEIRGIQPPRESMDAFKAVQSARIDQETWREQAIGEGAEQVIAAEALGKQFIAEANGVLSSSMAKANSEVAMFDADLRAFEAGSPSVVLPRLRRDAWEQIVAHVRQIYMVPSASSGRAIRLSIPRGETSK